MAAARLIQQERFSKRRGFFANSQMRPRDVKLFCALDTASQNLLEQAMHRLGLSARAYHRILKIARTIADLDASPTINTRHIAEAIGYRREDRKEG